MTKIIKTVSSFLLIVLITLSCVNAVDLNLTENITSNTSSSNLAEERTNTSYTNTNSTTNYTNNTSINNNTITTPSATVSTSNFPESGLGLSNILNIFLIVVGIVLILLAIAILIKLKN